ncbi:membrane protein [Streptomyces sulfonofaciens]|uniref:Membrane protein n=2 Tax=Streptomyces sulfonofaciens TaxID=68272 RepID=A0A919L5Y4_9ACTN|nr:membrane protein [Streptomyces sulfonofaciens]
MERADRNFAELLQELRVTQTGVQILFAFLLTLAFTPRFPSLDSVQRGMYVATLLLAVLATVLFMAPAALHRGLFRRHAKPQIVDTSSRFAIAGMAALALALTGSVLLVVDVALGRPAGIGAGVAVFLLHAGLWGVMPLMARRRVPGPDTVQTPATGDGSRGPTD